VEGSFEEYVTARGDALLRFAYVLSGDRHLAEDLVQEVLSRIHGRWPRMARIEQPDAYLRTAIVRQFLSWRRRRASGETPTDPLPEQVSIADTASRHAAQDEMWRLLATLPRQQRAVLVLRYYEGLTDHEIAETLRCGSGTVRAYASRALAALRIEITDAEGALS
jgi:RNA polymerase sigma-70 factor (sigma-E family)